MASGDGKTGSTSSCFLVIPALEASLDAQLCSERAKAALTEAISVAGIFSWSRASTRLRASSTLASSMFSAVTAISVTMDTRSPDEPFAYGQEIIVVVLAHIHFVGRQLSHQPDVLRKDPHLAFHKK
jgi:hypothetical protein